MVGAPALGSEVSQRSNSPQINQCRGNQDGPLSHLQILITADLKVNGRALADAGRALLHTAFNYRHKTRFPIRCICTQDLGIKHVRGTKAVLQIVVRIQRDTGTKRIIVIFANTESSSRIDDTNVGVTCSCLGR